MTFRHPVNGGLIGFTLIELLLAIAIIGLLVTGSMYALNQGRVKSRDAKRIADLSTIAKALELYYTDKGAYPPIPCGYDCDGFIASYDAANWGALEATLSPYLASKLPVDPSGGGCAAGDFPWTKDGCYAYTYGNVGHDTYDDTYDLSAKLETPNHPESCGQKNRYYYWDDRSWCPTPATNQMYEASPQ